MLPGNCSYDIQPLELTLDGWNDSDEENYTDKDGEEMDLIFTDILNNAFDIKKPIHDVVQNCSIENYKTQEIAKDEEEEEDENNDDDARFSYMGSSSYKPSYSTTTFINSDVQSKGMMLYNNGLSIGCLFFFVNIKNQIVSKLNSTASY